ncbi:hypothetical protein CMV_019149 [Castanea mollissima]|uniref:Uncharacterized protein n=1 Tax=Castanea mollissima TaxID=60419 RepID=A0A8J4VBT8_9ROSI|nr:hypothetical protein CMV_019149 [Castanea mollissima]
MWVGKLEFYVGIFSFAIATLFVFCPVYECDSVNNFLINKRSCYFGLERPLGLSDDNACIVGVNDGNPSFDIRGSLSLPIDVIDSGKCLAIERIEWNYQLDKLRQKSPSTIGLLSEKQCLDLEVDGELPVNGPVHAGQVPPTEIVAVCVTPSSRKGFHGLYIFTLGCKFPELFQKAGLYTFKFSLKDSTCNNCIKRVLVKASSEVGKWELLDGEQNPQYNVRMY